MGALLDKIAKDLNETGYRQRSTAARAWIRAEARKLGGASRASLMRDAPGRASPYPGTMFFMYYHPKGEKDLPYWDRFPLVMPIEMYSDGFLGLNFHYLPVNLRVHLLDALYSLASNKKFDDTTRIKASYDILNGASRFREFKPCVKRYLSAHIQSNVIAVEPDKWDIAIFLPVEQFQKAGSGKVWADSRNKI